MKKKQILILSMFLCFFAKSFAQITFTDLNFKNALLTHSPVIDTNGNNQIEISEAAAATKLNIINKNISNLEGLKYFTNLDFLDCSDNNIQKINTETLTELRFLIAERNELVTIDVRNCQLWSLRLDGNPIEYAYLTGRNGFQLEATYGIDFGYDQILNMKYVCVSQQQIGPISLPLNHRERVWDRLGSALHIGECTIQTPVACEPINFPDPNFKQALLNQFPIIDTDGDGEICIKEAEATFTIDAYNRGNINDVSGIEYFINLQRLFLSKNTIKAIDLSSNLSLEVLYINENKLTNITNINSAYLKKINVSANMLSQINITKNVNLINFYASDNKLDQLDVSKNLSLEGLSINNNLLTQLDISRNTKLTSVSISQNQLSTLNTDNNIELNTLILKHNKINSINTTNNINLANLDVSYNQIAKINIDNNKKLKTLSASSNFLNSINISNNKELLHLNLNFNKIKELNITPNNKKLKTISLKANNLTELDIRNCTSVDYLYLPFNNLKNLYLTGNHSIYTNLTSKLIINNNSYLNFTCVNPTYLSQTSNYIKNTLGYSSCIVSTSCSTTTPVVNFDTYFALSPNPTDSYLKITLKNVLIPTILNTSIYNAQTGAFIKNVTLHFTSPFDFSNQPNPRGEPTPNNRAIPSYTPRYQLIDCNDLQKGPYILQIRTSIGVVTKKFIKSIDAIR